MGVPTPTRRSHFGLRGLLQFCGEVGMFMGRKGTGSRPNWTWLGAALSDYTEAEKSPRTSNLFVQLSKNGVIKMLVGYILGFEL